MFTDKNKIIAVSIAIVAVLALGIVWYFFPSAENVQLKAAVEAARLNNSGDYAGAQNFLLEKIKTDSSPELKLLLANSYLDEGAVRGRETEASEKARDILFGLDKSYYQSAYLYVLLGYSYEIVGDFDNALGYYGRALILDKTSVSTLFGIGNANRLNGNLARAKEYYDKAENNINKSTDNSVSIKVYAAQGKMSGAPEKSEEYFLKALPLADSKAFKSELYANLSHAKYLQNDLPNAIEYAGLAIKTDPSNELGYIAYAKATISDKVLLQKNAQKVEEYLVKAIFLAPRKAESQYWMGKLDFVLGKYDLAIKSYDTARIFIPKDNTLGKSDRDVLLSDILFDESIVYFFKKDGKYLSYLKEAFKYNPVKTLYMLDKDTALKEMRAALISSNIFLMAKFKP